ncbi:MAG: hypothetical protein NTW71_14350 [Deltaproteobacteria bacterium]|nr:hypothetical protein [Deltaproteobacteria bacterium]
MKSYRRTLFAVVCCLMLVLLAGCAALSLVTARQETLEERVKNYMQAQIDGKWDRAWSFFDSSSRESIRREIYVNRSRTLSFSGYGIDEITVLPSGDQATVKVSMDVSFMGHAFKGMPLTQKWVKESGAWFVNEPQSLKTPFYMQQKQQ